MSKKSKGLILNSTPLYGGGVYEDAKARMRHQALMLDYQELEKEADIMRSKLEVAKQRKLTLAAEVRFLRRRHKFLMEMKSTPVLQDRRSVQQANSLKKMKQRKEKALITKDSISHRLPPPAPEPEAKKKHILGKILTAGSPLPVQEHPQKKTLHNNRKEVVQANLIPVSGLNRKGRINIRREPVTWNPAPLLELNQKEKTHGPNNPAFRKSVPAFDLNQDTIPCAKEASLPARALIFDLNEISTGDEDFHSGIEAPTLEEAKKSVIRGLNEDQQNDLKLSICRNAGEGTSRSGKRKISWQDPVALRV